MTPELDKLIEKARTVTMTPEQREAQRRSFVYGNTKIENERITRASIKTAAETLARKNEPGHTVTGGGEDAPEDLGLAH